MWEPAFGARKGAFFISDFISDRLIFAHLKRWLSSDKKIGAKNKACIFCLRTKAFFRIDTGLRFLAAYGEVSEPGLRSTIGNRV